MEPVARIAPAVAVDAVDGRTRNELRSAVVTINQKLYHQQEVVDEAYEATCLEALRRCTPHLPSDIDDFALQIIVQIVRQQTYTVAERREPVGFRSAPPPLHVLPPYMPNETEDELLRAEVGRLARLARCTAEWAMECSRESAR